MTDEEAIDVLIGFAVCSSSKLHCDTDCPFYEEENHCKYVVEEKDFELEEAVKILKERK